MNKTPAAVLISDIHFTPATLELAAVSLLRAQFKAKILDVPLIIAGDTLDTKAVMRAECVNRLMQLLSVKDAPDTYVLVGNHDLINEKGSDHSLRFLQCMSTVVDRPHTLELEYLDVMLLPYYSDLDKLTALLVDEDVPRALIMHQGVQTADLGHYVQDKTSLPPEAFDGFRVISGHYHKAQTIKCGKTGLFSYIGNPYTLTFGEANDGPKGFQILYSDGSLELVPTNLRKHVIYEIDSSDLQTAQKPNVSPEDLVWVKIRGPKSTLDALNKNSIGTYLLGHTNYKLDLIPTDSPAPQVAQLADKSDAQLMDEIIDRLADTDEHKDSLKRLWRSVT